MKKNMVDTHSHTHTCLFVLSFPPICMILDMEHLFSNGPRNEDVVVPVSVSSYSTQKQRWRVGRKKYGASQQTRARQGLPSTVSRVIQVHFIFVF